MGSGTYAVLIALSFWEDTEKSFEALVDLYQLYRLTLIVRLHERGFRDKLVAIEVDGGSSFDMCG